MADSREFDDPGRNPASDHPAPDGALGAESGGDDPDRGGDGDDAQRRWPTEPDPEARWNDLGPDPEARWNEPERELSTADAVDVPTVDPPDAEPSREVKVSFWAAVLFANLGLLLVSVGPMIAYFLGRPTLGGGILLAGTVALWRVYRIYRSFSRDEAADGGDDPAADDSDGSADATEPGASTADRGEKR